MWWILGTLFGQGMLHGVGPDHCLAIGALASRGDLRRSLAVAARFGAGHTLMLGACAAVAGVAGVAIPAAWESRMEVLGGLSLLALGVWTLLRSTAHGHGHAHGDDHTHADEGWRESLAGAVFGLSGVRGMLMALPFVVQRDRVLTALGVALFGLGVVASMLAVGWVAQRVAGASTWLERALRTAVGVASVLLGAWWVVDHLGPV